MVEGDSKQCFVSQPPQQGKDIYLRVRPRVDCSRLSGGGNESKTKAKNVLQ